MNSHPLVSVILPTHNRAAWLPWALASVWEQDCGDVEVVVIDDASTDDTAEVCARQPRPVHYIRRETCGGPAVARNQGVNESHGEILAFLDSDDLWLPGALRALLAGLEAPPPVQVVMGQTAIIKAGAPDDPAPAILPSLTGYSFHLMAKVLRRSLWERMGGLDPARRHGEDIDFHMRLVHALGPIRQVNAVCALHRRGAQSMTEETPEAERGVLHSLHAALQRRRGLHPAMNTVSVIIPARNAAQYLAEALESALAQTEAAREIIVVDNGSTDATAEIARGYAPAVRLIPEPRVGLAYARNAGLAAASGGLICMLDADDLWPPDRNAILRAALETDPQLDAVGGLIEQFICPRLPEEEARTIHCPPQASAAQLPGALMVRRALYGRAGLYSPRYQVGDCVDWVLRAREAGARFGTVSEVVLRRRLHHSNMGQTMRDFRHEYLRAVKEKLDRARAPR